MKHLSRALVLLIVALLWAAPASAQTTIDNTTLSAAISTPQAANTNAATTVSIASVTCTGCTFGRDTVLYIDLEAMQVTGAYVSGTTGIPVTRGVFGTRAAAHKNAAVVMLGPPQRFHMASQVNGGDPAPGLCVLPGDYLGFKPWVNVNSGGSWVCDGNPAVWRVTYIINRSDNSRALSWLHTILHDPITAFRTGVRW